MTIRSNVIAMAPNHPFSGHWPSTRRLHGHFKYLGEGRFSILEKNNKDISQVKEIETEEISEQEESSKGVGVFSRPGSGLHGRG